VFVLAAELKTLRARFSPSSLFGTRATRHPQPHKPRVFLSSSLFQQYQTPLTVPSLSAVDAQATPGFMSTCPSGRRAAFAAVGVLVAALLLVLFYCFVVRDPPTRYYFTAAPSCASSSSASPIDVVLIVVDDQSIYVENALALIRSLLWHRAGHLGSARAAVQGGGATAAFGAPLRFHLVCTTAVEQQMRAAMHDLLAARLPCIEVHFVAMARLLEAYRELSAGLHVHTSHAAHETALAKLALPLLHAEFGPTVQQLFFLDVDQLFTESVAVLRAEAEAVFAAHPSALVAMPLMHRSYDPGYHTPNGYIAFSSVIAFHMERALHVDLRAALRALLVERRSSVVADQVYWNLLYLRRPELTAPLHCSWNYYHRFADAFTASTEERSDDVRWPALCARHKPRVIHFSGYDKAPATSFFRDYYVGMRSIPFAWLLWC
jgi:hypothetical protein